MRASVILGALAALFAFATPAAAQSDDSLAGPEGPSGVYRGIYLCNQGLTGATVRFCEVGGQVEVGFRFYAIDENPELPTGLCYLRGDYDDVARIVSAEAAGWGSRPGDNWIIAPFTGVFANDYQSFSGQVNAPGCGFITLRRVADDVDEAPECGPVIG